MPPRTLKAAQRKARAMEQTLLKAQRKVAKLKALHELKRDPQHRELADRLKKIRHELHQGRLNVPRHAKRIVTLERLLKKKREEHAAAEKRLSHNEKEYLEVTAAIEAMTEKKLAAAGQVVAQT